MGYDSSKLAAYGAAISLIATFIISAAQLISLPLMQMDVLVLKIGEKVSAFVTFVLFIYSSLCDWTVQKSRALMLRLKRIRRSNLER